MTVRAPHIVAAALLAPLVAIACYSLGLTPLPCSSDAACEQGQSCVDGACRAGEPPLVDDAGEPDDDAGESDNDAGPPDAGPADAGPDDAGPDDAGPPDAGPTDAGPATFRALYDDVMIKWCMPCHLAPTEPGDGYAPPGPINLATPQSGFDSLVGTVTGPTPGDFSLCDDGLPYVVPGDPASSLMYQKVAGVADCGLQMPAFGPPYPSPAEVDRIAQWIADGAVPGDLTETVDVVDTSSFTDPYNVHIKRYCLPCHLNEDVKWGTLDMSSQNVAWQNLIGFESAGFSCEGSGLTRVVPFDPGSSLLIHKINALPADQCGLRMPYIGPAVPAAVVEDLTEWIQGGAIP